MIVVDASFVVTWFVAEPQSEAAAALIPLAGQPLHLFAAPDILVLEVTAVMGKRARRGQVSMDYPACVLRMLQRMPITRVPDGELIDHAALLSETLRHPIYDCLYLALARRLFRQIGKPSTKPLLNWRARMAACWSSHEPHRMPARHRQ